LPHYFAAGSGALYVAASWFVVGGGIIRRGRGAAGGGLFTGGACVCVGGPLFDIRVREIVAC